MENTEAMKMSEALEQGRTAFAFKPVGSPAVMNVTTYAFGSDPESTRSDRVRRIPTTAIIIHKRGRLIDCQDPESPAPLPDIALLGPSLNAHFWATQPNTEFLMVNLAPGATRKLFDIEPGDIRDQVETLKGHDLAGTLHRGAMGGAEVLHDHLCRLIREKQVRCDRTDARTRSVVESLRKRIFGVKVSDYADRLGTTCRTLQRLIRSEMGLTPKHIIAIERMRTLIRLTAGGWTQTAADLAQAGGFFDQSHLRYEMSRHQMGTVGELVGGDHIVVKN